MATPKSRSPDFQGARAQEFDYLAEFYDVNQTTWVPSSNNATLSAAGAGLDWSGPYRWHARISIATAIAPTPELVGSATSTSVWGEIGRSF